jgi:outer membrane protein assembly factor BamB
VGGDEARHKAKQILEASGVRGGLVVHIACGDGQLTAALRAHDSCLVHGLDGDAGAVAAARAYLMSQGVYGKVSVDLFDGKHLPYADSLVNLVVSEAPGAVSRREIMRVLAPLGVAYVRRGGRWQKTVKPWPDDIDDWSHHLHAANGNQVARDRRVGPPTQLRWVAAPYRNRDHRYGNNSFMLSNNGRLFYVANEVPVPSIDTLPDRQTLTARDAFSGVLLWKRPLVSRDSDPALRPPDERDGTVLYEPEFPLEFKVVAAAGKLFGGFGRNGAVLALDAASGRVVRIYEGTEQAGLLFYHHDLLLVAAPDGLPEERRGVSGEGGSVVRAIKPDTGKVVREYPINGGETRAVPALSADRLFFVSDGAIRAADLATGNQLWQKPLPAGGASPLRLKAARYAKAPTAWDRLIACGDVLLLAASARKGTLLQAFSADRGEVLWRVTHPNPERSGHHVFVIGDRVWVEDPGRGRDTVALDLRTGTVVARRDFSIINKVGHHHRCYGNRATERFILYGRRGVEFANVETGEVRLHHWVRGKCRLGVLPCNGLLYSAAHGCSCYPYATWKGYSALASGAPEVYAAEGDRLEKGPAYGPAGAGDARDVSAPWPTLRHDAARSGSTLAPVPVNALEPVWTADLGSLPTALTVGADQVFVATPSDHRLHALDAKSGRRRWSFTAGGRIDSPPSLWQELVVFGCSDGFVYCLKATDGERVWRFRAAPRDRRVVVDSGLESAWPVHGAVLIDRGIVYFTAGRSSLLDGGLYAWGLDPRTGAAVAEQRLYSPYEQVEKKMIGNTGRTEGEYGIALLGDVLVAAGDHLYLRRQRLDRELRPIDGTEPYVVSQDGLLRESWFSRVGWFLGRPRQESRRTAERPERYDILRSVRQGQYLVVDEVCTYSLRLHTAIGKFNRSHRPGTDGYAIFADDNTRLANRWQVKIPVHVTAMLAAANSLFVAGAPDRIDPEDPWGAIEGRKGGILMALSKADGAKQAAFDLTSPPVFDGMAAGNGTLFLGLRDGSVVCFSGKRR